MPSVRRGAVAGFTSGTSFGRGGESVGGLSIPATARVAAPNAGAAPADWLDFSKVPAWRAVYTVAALAYLGVFHFSLPGGIATVGRAGGSLPHGHGLAVGLYVASWLVVIDAVRDIVMYAYPEVPAAAALKQTL